MIRTSQYKLLSGKTVHMEFLPAWSLGVGVKMEGHGVIDDLFHVQGCFWSFWPAGWVADWILLPLMRRVTSGLV